ncbi:hypothetical protein [Vibrio splendidus]|uniref:hypothetical protein n=1 Tax=Vibrio splendidus TaxID=29497 RepID=UPI000E329326|nr:hypothetical protein [Vibrio splendidus]
MSIKTSISLFLLMMGFSFSAYSQTYKVTSIGWGCEASLGLSVGSSFDDSYFGSLADKKVTNCGTNTHETIGRAFYYNGKIGYNRPSDSRTHTLAVNISKISECPPGSQLNPSTGICEQPPVCEPPAILDPDTLECVTPAFCDRESTNDALFEAEQSCAAEGGIFSFECNDFLETLETRCTQSDQCAIGFPNWPACLDDLDPSDDISPPSGGFDPSNPPTANPDGPSFDKPEPDDVTPTDTTDKAVLEAVQNANRDSNEGFKALSTDLNKGFTDTNNSLAQLNATNTAIGNSVVEQMNQDYAIHQANKDLALQQTGAITAGASAVTGALGAQTDSLTGALGEQTDALTGAIGELADKIPEKCEPNAQNNYCENPHGLSRDYIGETFQEMTSVTDVALTEGHSVIETTLQSVIDNPLTGENEAIMNDATAHLLNLLDYNKSCRPLSFEANGKSYSVDCHVSTQIKLVLSFLIGMYTLMTLIDILIDGIVPLGSKPSATRYA